MTQSTNRIAGCIRDGDSPKFQNDNSEGKHASAEYMSVILREVPIKPIADAYHRFLPRT